MEARTAEEIIADLRTKTPETIGSAVLALTDEEITTLHCAKLPSHEEYRAFVADLSDPNSPNYDEDLATQ